MSKYTITAETNHMAWMEQGMSAGGDALARFRLCLDPDDGSLSIRRNNDGGTISDEWFGFVQCFSLPLLVDPVEVARAVNDSSALDALIERVTAGYERAWNGNNHVGRYDDDAIDALNEISRWIDGAALLPADQIEAEAESDWWPTHVIHHGEDTIIVKCVPADEVGEAGDPGAICYTLDEWNYSISADWEVDASGVLCFQGGHLHGATIEETK